MMDDRWIAGRLDQRIGRSVDRWIGGSVDRWIGGSVDRRLDTNCAGRKAKGRPGAAFFRCGAMLLSCAPDPR